MAKSSQDKSHVLVVDDEPDICEIIALTLEPHYENIVCSSDSQSASKLITEQEFDLVLSDIMMPNLLGPDLIRFMRGRGILTPVVFITGQATKETLICGMRLGVSDIIEKPFEPDLLLSSVRRVIEVEKRKKEWTLAKSDQSLTPEQLEKKRKMIGLFLVATEKQKAS